MRKENYALIRREYEFVRVKKKLFNPLSKSQMIIIAF